MSRAAPLSLSLSPGISAPANVVEVDAGRSPEEKLAREACRLGRAAIHWPVALRIGVSVVAAQDSGRYDLIVSRSQGGAQLAKLASLTSVLPATDFDRSAGLPR